MIVLVACWRHSPPEHPVPGAGPLSSQRPQTVTRHLGFAFNQRVGGSGGGQFAITSSVPCQRYGQNHVSPKPLPDKIPINGKPLAASRGFVLRRLSDAGLCTGL